MMYKPDLADRSAKYLQKVTFFHAFFQGYIWLFAGAKWLTILESAVNDTHKPHKFMKKTKTCPIDLKLCMLNFNWILESENVQSPLQPTGFLYILSHPYQ